MLTQHEPAGPDDQSLARGRRPRKTLALLAGVCLALIAVGCSEIEPEPYGGRFPYIQDERFKLEEPSQDHAAATGIGCGATEKEAYDRARKTAHYNLRGVAGNQTYAIEFTNLGGVAADKSYAIEFTPSREVPSNGQVCVEVEAQAISGLARRGVESRN